MFCNNILSPLVHSLEHFADCSAFCIANKYYTYSQLALRISAIRQQILSTDTKEQVFGLALHDDIDTYAAIFALWMEGKAYVALHPLQPIERNANIIKQVGTHYVLDSADNSAFGDWANENEVVVISTAKAQTFALNLHDWKQVSEEELAYVLFTSGSTGVPKGVPLSRQNLSAFIDAFWNLGYQLDKNDRCLQCFDLTFDLSVMSYLVPMLVGACAYTVPYNKIKWSYTYILLEDYQLTFALMTPSTIQYLLPYMKDIHLPEMRYSLFCGEALPLNNTQAWADCIPNAQIDNVYGPTEDTIFCTAYRYRREGNNIEHNGVLSIGTSMTSGKVIILDENNGEIKDGRVGELCLSGEQLTQGYWHNPEKNAEAFFFYTDPETGLSTRYYRSGDLCMYADDGNILFVGRKDSQVKVNGYRIELGEIEHHARLFLNNTNLIVMAYTNSQNNTELSMFIESKETDITPLTEHLKTILPPYMLPSKYLFVPSFPVNASNKIDRSALKKML
ncbi:MAG: AMP-binding protein [Paludibacteraceae bacterium]|nr:AMP-binding protein [Paludibacteraceae bacterium]